MAEGNDTNAWALVIAAAWQGAVFFIVGVSWWFPVRWRQLKADNQVLIVKGAGSKRQDKVPPDQASDPNLQGSDLEQDRYSMVNGKYQKTKDKGFVQYENEFGAKLHTNCPSVHRIHWSESEKRWLIQKWPQGNLEGGPVLYRGTEKKIINEPEYEFGIEQDSDEKKHDNPTTVEWRKYVDLESGEAAGDDHVSSSSSHGDPNVNESDLDNAWRSKTHSQEDSLRITAHPLSSLLNCMPVLESHHKAKNGEDVLNNAAVKIYLSFLVMYRNLFIILSLVSVFLVLPTWGYRPFLIVGPEDGDDSEDKWYGFIVSITHDVQMSGLQTLCSTTILTSLIALLFALKFQKDCRASQEEEQMRRKCGWLSEIPVKDQATLQPHLVTLSVISKTVEKDLKEAINDRLRHRADDESRHKGRTSCPVGGMACPCVCCTCQLACTLVVTCCPWWPKREAPREVQREASASLATSDGGSAEVAHAEAARAISTSRSPLLGPSPLQVAGDEHPSAGAEVDPIHQENRRASLSEFDNDYVEEIVVQPVMSQYAEHIKKYLTIKKYQERVKAFQWKMEQLKYACLKNNLQICFKALEALLQRPQEQQNPMHDHLAEGRKFLKAMEALRPDDESLWNARVRLDGFGRIAPMKRPEENHRRGSTVSQLEDEGELENELSRHATICARVIAEGGQLSSMMQMTSSQTSGVQHTPANRKNAKRLNAIEVEMKKAWTRGKKLTEGKDFVKVGELDGKYYALHAGKPNPKAWSLALECRNFQDGNTKEIIYQEEIKPKWEWWAPNTWYTHLRYKRFVLALASVQSQEDTETERFLGEKTDFSLELSGHAFVVFKDWKYLDSMLQPKREWYEMRDYAHFQFGRPPFSSVTLQCRQAPHPTDFYWDNLHTPFCPNYFFHVLRLLLLIVITVAVVIAISVFSNITEVTRILTIQSRFEWLGDGLNFINKRAGWFQSLPSMILLSFNSIVVPVLIDCVASTRRYSLRSWGEMLQLNLNFIVLILSKIVFPFVAFTVIGNFTLPHGDDIKNSCKDGQCVKGLCDDVTRTICESYKDEAGAPYMWTKSFIFVPPINVIGRSGNFYLNYCLNCAFLSNAITLTQLARHLYRKAGLLWSAVTKSEKKTYNECFAWAWGYWYAWNLTIAANGLIFGIVVPSMLPITALNFALKHMVDRELFKEGAFDPGPSSMGIYAPRVVHLMVVIVASKIIAMGGAMIFLYLSCMEVQNDRNSSADICALQNGVACLVWGIVLVVSAVVCIAISQMSKAQQSLEEGFKSDVKTMITEIGERVLSFIDWIFSTGFKQGEHSAAISTPLLAKEQPKQVLPGGDEFVCVKCGQRERGEESRQQHEDQQQQVKLSWDAREHCLQSLMEKETDKELRDQMCKLLGKKWDGTTGKVENIINLEKQKRNMDKFEKMTQESNGELSLEAGTPGSQSVVMSRANSPEAFPLKRLHTMPSEKEAFNLQQGRTRRYSSMTDYSIPVAETVSSRRHSASLEHVSQQSWEAFVSGVETPEMPIDDAVGATLLDNSSASALPATQQEACQELLEAPTPISPTGAEAILRSGAGETGWSAWDPPFQMHEALTSADEQATTEVATEVGALETPAESRKAEKSGRGRKARTRPLNEADAADAPDEVEEAVGPAPSEKPEELEQGGPVSLGAALPGSPTSLEADQPGGPALEAAQQCSSGSREWTRLPDLEEDMLSGVGGASDEVETAEAVISQSGSQRASPKSAEANPAEPHVLEASICTPRAVGEASATQAPAEEVLADEVSTNDAVQAQAPAVEVQTAESAVVEGSIVEAVIGKASVKSGVEADASDTEAPAPGSPVLGAPDIEPVTGEGDSSAGAKALESVVSEKSADEAAGPCGTGPNETSELAAQAPSPESETAAVDASGACGTPTLDIPSSLTTGPASESICSETAVIEAGSPVASAKLAAETEATAVESPATDVPALEASVGEVTGEASAKSDAVTEAPGAEAPSTDSPTLEAPATGAPTLEAVVAEAPPTETPAANPPAAKAPIEQDVEAQTAAAPVLIDPSVDLCQEILVTAEELISTVQNVSRSSVYADGEHELQSRSNGLHLPGEVRPATRDETPPLGPITNRGSSAPGERRPDVPGQGSERRSAPARDRNSSSQSSAPSKPNRSSPKSSTSSRQSREHASPLDKIDEQNVSTTLNDTMLNAMASSMTGTTEADNRERNTDSGSRSSQGTADSGSRSSQSTPDSTSRRSTPAKKKKKHGGK